MAVVYSEIAPSPIPELYENAKGNTHLRVECYFACDWSNVNDVCAYLYSEAGSQYRDVANCIVRRVKTLSRGQISGTATAASYTSAVLRVIYDTDGPRWVNGVYRDEMILPDDFRVVPPAGLQWSDGDMITAEEMAHAPMVTGAMVVMSIGRATTPDSSALAYINCCNSAGKSCYLFPYTFASQTLLYGTPIVKAHTDYAIGTRYSTEWRHVYNPNGWNKFWHAKNAAWEYAYSGEDIYIEHPVTW